MFIIEKTYVQIALGQMCAYGYKGIACYLADEFQCTIEDLRIRDNYALYYAINNNQLAVVQWLLRLFPYTKEEVTEILHRRKSMYLKETTEEIKQFVNEFLQQNLKTVLPERQEKEEKECCICMERRPDIILEPCGHKCICSICEKKISHCPRFESIN